jgi:hypothetical protein
MGYQNQIKTTSKNTYHGILEVQFDVYFIDHNAVYRDQVFSIFSIG